MRLPPRGRPATVRRLAATAAVALAAVVSGCAGADSEGPSGTSEAPRAEPSAQPTSAAPTSESSSADPDATPLHSINAKGYSRGLHDELMAMFRRDQAGRTTGKDDEGDAARTLRLAEMIEQYGWPGWTLVGEDGEDASWVIAQHSDLDVDFQQQALALLEQAVADGDASPGNLAYLTDRVAANLGDPQTYGTQMGCEGTEVVPQPPLADPDDVDALREEAGLGTLAEYYEVELEGACG
jgi:hypothetical protein